MVRFFNSVKLPLLLILLLVGFDLLARLGILPPSQEVSEIINSALEIYGLIIIAPLAFLENIAGINIYFPGSIVILTTMAVSAGNPVRAVEIFLTYYVFAILAYHVDYFMGKPLRSKRIQLTSPQILASPTNAKLWLRFLILFSHPQLASILCAQVGGEGYKYSDVIKYFLFFGFVWTLFWSVVMYSVGAITGPSIDLNILAYAYLLGLLGFNIYQYFEQQPN